MKKPLYFIAFNIIIIIVLSLVQVVIANSISTTGIELAKLQSEISELKKKNALLHEKILTSASLTKIASAASAMGFEETTSQIVISAPLPLARR